MPRRLVKRQHALPAPVRVHRLLPAGRKRAQGMRLDRNLRPSHPADRPASWLRRVDEALRRAALSRRVRKLDRAIAQAVVDLRDAERHSWMALKRQAAACASLCIARAALRARLESIGAPATAAEGDGDPRCRQAGTPDTAVEGVRRATRR
jgi:hypothetical protein